MKTNDFFKKKKKKIIVAKPTTNWIFINAHSGYKDRLNSIIRESEDKVECGFSDHIYFKIHFRVKNFKSSTKAWIILIKYLNNIEKVTLPVIFNCWLKNYTRIESKITPMY